LGFLPVRRTDPAADLNEGARVLVQIRRESRRGKGAVLSARIASRSGKTDLPGLAQIAAPLDPPAQLQPAPGFATALAMRVPDEPERVLVDDPGVLGELRAAFPAADIAYRSHEVWPADLDALFDIALAPTLALAGGGLLRIEECHAAVLIDVDSGTPETGSAARTALRVNLAAAEVIGRQLRLRGLGGGIVVDFVGLDGSRPRERVRRAMEAALKPDPAQPQVLGWTRLGHLELVRPRRGRPLSEAMLDPQGAGKSAVALAFAALRALHREARAIPAANWRLAVSRPVGAVLQGPAAAALRALETRLGRRVAVAVEAASEAPPFDIAPI
jgi:ribonuclease G